MDQQDQNFLECICSVAGICILVGGIFVRKKLLDSKFWPKTTGIIQESSVKPKLARIGGDFIYVVSPKVIYEYRVGGVKYLSSNLALVEVNSANEEVAQEKARPYSAGQQVEVFYNPKKPEYAVLKVGDPTAGKLPYGIIIFGTVVTISGIIWLLISHT